MFVVSFLAVTCSVTQAKKKANEHVRQLVSFVQRRDPRVAAHKDEVAAQKLVREQQDKEAKEAKKSAMAEERLRQQRELEEYYQNLEAEGFDDVDEEDANETAVEAETLYCVACRKSFKNQKAFDNHGKSKKHKRAVELLRQELLEEDIDEDQNSSQEEFCAPCEDQSTNADVGEELKLLAGSRWTWVMLLIYNRLTRCV